MAQDKKGRYKGGNQVVEVRKLTKRYGQIKAVDNISFTVNKGEILGFLGPNGAGKTTTMNIITGYIPATSGSVKVAGIDVMEEPAEAKKKIGYLPEQLPLYRDMTVWEQLCFAAELKKVDRHGRKRHIDELTDMMMIGDVRNRLIKNLSKGYRQRVGLAQALIGAPEVLILDEPTVGLDPKQIIDMRNVIKSLAGSRTIILSSHILPEVSAVCERVVIINKGEIAAVDTPQNLSQLFSGAVRTSVTVEGPPDEVKRIINRIEGITRVEARNTGDSAVSNYIIEAGKGIDIRKPLFFAMAEAGHPILEMKPIGVSLEEVFLQLTTEEKEAV